MELIKMPIESAKKYLWIAALYFVTVGVLYLWAYWSSFGINILEYASLSDVARVAIIPVGSAVLFIVSGVIFAELMIVNKRYFPAGGGKGTRIGEFLNKHDWLFSGAYAIIGVLLLISRNPNRWIALPIWGAVLPWLAIKRAGFLEEIKNDSVRSVMLFLIVILPLVSFGQGKIHAEQILGNNEYLYVPGAAPGEDMKYVGFINQITFLISKDNQQIRIIRLDKEAMDLLKYTKKKTGSDDVDAADSE